MPLSRFESHHDHGDVILRRLPTQVRPEILGQAIGNGLRVGTTQCTQPLAEPIPTIDLTIGIEGFDAAIRHQDDPIAGLQVLLEN